jgi:hypothetical protein
MRPTFRDPRVHYAVNCASIGCPNLRPRAFRAATLERDLDDAARAFVNHPRGVTVLGDGRLDLDALEALLRAGPALVAVMAANNETGVLHPIEAVAALCAAHGAHLHVDGVQAAGRVALAPGWHSLAISGHKLGGPMGAGALLLAPGLHPRAIMAGGGQERGRRGGTEPLPAIAGMAAAAQAGGVTTARAGGAVLGAPRGVFGGGDGQFRRFAALPLRVEPSQERHAPLAARSGAEAIRELAGNARLLPLHEVHQLALADTEAEADVVVGVH